MRRKQCTILKWPALSPDLYSTEHQWTQLNLRLSKITHRSSENRCILFEKSDIIVVWQQRNVALISN